MTWTVYVGLFQPMLLFRGLHPGLPTSSFPSSAVCPFLCSLQHASISCYQLISFLSAFASCPPLLRRRVPPPGRSVAVYLHRLCLRIILPSLSLLFHVLSQFLLCETFRGDDHWVRISIVSWQGNSEGISDWMMQPLFSSKSDAESEWQPDHQPIFCFSM